MQERSYGSVRIFWLNHEEVLRRLKGAVRRLLKDRKEVEEVRLFGSFAEGRAIPGSDVDLLLVLSKADTPFLQRPQLYLDYFADIELPCDLFCYTREEIEKNSFAQKIYNTGVPL